MLLLRLEDDELEQLVQRVVVRVLEKIGERGFAPRSPFVTIPEAANFLRCSRQRVDDLLSSGRLRRHKDGRRTLIRRAELEAYVEGHGSS